MLNSDAVFAGSIPATYDRHLGPALFVPFAEDLAARIAPFVPRSVLEVAAGTGILTQRLVAALPDATITATDLNAAMVHYAAEAIVAPKLTWSQADALALPFADETFDAVIAQFGVMFYPDKDLGFSQAYRVLRSGGRFFFSVWDRIEENPLAHELELAIGRFFPEDPPRFVSRTPHGYYDSEAITAALQRAGFHHVEFDRCKLTCEAESARSYALGFCTGSPLRNEIVARDASSLDAAVDAVTAALESRFGADKPRASMQALVFTATRLA